jgi:hypothetical protein
MGPEDIGMRLLSINGWNGRSLMYGVYQDLMDEKLG